MGGSFNKQSFETKPFLPGKEAKEWGLKNIDLNANSGAILQSIGTAFKVGKRCALSDGFSLHANVQIKRNERNLLEKLCRYTARSPIALERLSEREDGKILYELKTKYSDGTTHILFDPTELVEKVVALIPPPRANLLRYHGVLASNSKIRGKIVPQKEKEKEKPAVPQNLWVKSSPIML